MELITIILYSLLILIAALVVFIGISYIVSAFKKKNDRAKLVQQSNYQSVPQQYATPVSDNIIIRKEVENYYEDQIPEQRPVYIEKPVQQKPKIRRERREKPKPQKRVNRYSVVNNNVLVSENNMAFSAGNYNSMDLNDHFTNYEDANDGIYYNIKIGA